MGIKGIYGEIGPGKRVALSKLAIETLETTRRPLRIAIDVSIWQFQIQASRGGSNPAHRTFYYRLLRLLSVSVQPIFVFDGPNKPKFKRGKRSGHGGASLSNFMCKQMLNLFGFPIHMAPGEAEAECALLQREGIVDAVLSEDVDTLMFGCGITLRNWSADGKAKTPTHVNLYDADVTRKGTSGLDREGMVLVALMSGGDYIVEGIPGVGIKVACEAARAGFGKTLCQLSRLDSESLTTWWNSLSHELQTNENKYFRCKHKALTIPDTFPDPEVLGYYTHPVVSTASKIRSLKAEISWDAQIDIQGLRAFVSEAFEWSHISGAKKFIRTLAPVLLVHMLRVRGDRRESGYGDLVLTQMNEMALVRAICGKRTHMSTDGMPELRVIYHPNDIVGLDLDAEEDDVDDYGRDGLAPTNDDDQIEAYVSDERSTSPSRRGTPLYDPAQPEKLWVSETIAKIGIPLKVEDYEESLRNPKKFMKAKHAAKRAAAPKEPKAVMGRGGMPRGAMDKFVRTSKRIEEVRSSTTKSFGNTKSASREPSLPPVFLAPILGSFSPEPANEEDPDMPNFDLYTDAELKKRLTANGFKNIKGRAQMITLLNRCAQSERGLSSPAAARELSRSPVVENPTSKKTTAQPIDQNEKLASNLATKRKCKTKKAYAENSKSNTNPWTLSQTSHILNKTVITITKNLTHTSKQMSSPKFGDNFQPIDLSSSPPFHESLSSSPTVLRTPRKHSHSPDQSSDNESVSPVTPSRTAKGRASFLPSTASSEKDPCKPPFRKRQSSGFGSSDHSRVSTPEPGSRTIDFLSGSRVRSNSPELPPWGELHHPPPKLGLKTMGMETVVIDLLSSSPETPRESRINMSPRRRPPKNAAIRTKTPPVEKVSVLEEAVSVENLSDCFLEKKKKRFIMPRDSLPGSWKEVGEDQVKKGGRAFRYSEVEVLDMTEDQ